MSKREDYIVPQKIPRVTRAEFMSKRDSMPDGSYEVFDEVTGKSEFICKATLAVSPKFKSRRIVVLSAEYPK